MIIHLGNMISQAEWEKESPKLIGLIHKQLHTELGVHKDGYQHTQAYRRHVWDGIIDFYNMKEETFPTGLLEPLESILGNIQNSNPSFRWSLDDRRDRPIFNADQLTKPIELLDKDTGNITLRDYQMRGVKSAIQDMVSMVNDSTGSGKTEIAAGIVYTLLPYIQKEDKITFACFSKEIFYQTAKRFEERLGIRVGKFGDGKKEIRRVNVVMVQTLNRALQDPAKKVKLTSEKDRLTKKMAMEIAPLFVGKENVKHLISNWLTNFHPKTHIDEKVKEILIQTLSSNLSDKKLDMAMRKYQQMYGKLLEKKAGKAYKNYQDAKQYVADTKVLITDEAHHAVGDANYQVLLQFNSPYRVALSGTIDEDDPMGWQRMKAIFSHKSSTVRNKELIERDILAKPTVHMLTVTEPQMIMNEQGIKLHFENLKDWHMVYKYGIVNNQVRNELIIATASELYEAGLSILLTVNQTSQGDNLAKLLTDSKVPFEYLYGDIDSESRQAILGRVRTGETRILIGTTLMDEGVDLPKMNALVLCGGGKTSRGQLQRIGRVLRKKEGENRAYIFDFIDRTNWYLLNHSKSRIKIYEDEEFEIKYLK